MTTKLHRAARWYAQHGWRIFPLRPHTKEPFKDLGVYLATDDLAQIDAWWKRWPSANVGLNCGGSGIIALDADSYKDTYAGEGLLTLEDEQTLTSLTGSGGTHLLWKMPDGATYGNATGNLPKGVDVRGMGGYIVLPPSIHPNGNTYQWEAGYGPHEMPIAPLPEWLDIVLETCTQALADVSFSVQDADKPDIMQWRISRRTLECIETAPERGIRSETDQSVITALVAAGASNDEILGVFQHYPIGTDGKFSEKGRNALRYLAHSIAHARTWHANKQADERLQRAETLLRMAA